MHNSLKIDPYRRLRLERLAIVNIYHPIVQDETAFRNVFLVNCALF